MSLALRSHLDTLARRFPLAHYGFARALLYGKGEQSCQSLVVKPSREHPCFDCFFSSRETTLALLQEGINARIVHLVIPVKGEKPYQHYLTEIHQKKEYRFVDFTPFAGILGFRSGQIAFPETIRQILENYRATTELPGIGREHSLMLSKNLFGLSFFPLATWGGLLVEGSFQRVAGGSQAVMRVSKLVLGADRKELVRLGALSYRMCFPGYSKISPVVGEMTDEMRLAGARWQIDEQGEGIPDFELATVANWPAFAAFVNLINEHFCR